MGFGVFALYLVSFLISAFLSPKPKFENARASSLADLKFPRASEGDPVPFVIGKVLIESPNTLWYGGFRSVPIKKKVKTGIFSSKKVIIGYKYYITADLALCLGENAILNRMWIEKKIVYDGPALTGAPQDFVIDEASLFGGVDRQGGYVGTHTFYSGRFTEVADAFLVPLLPGDTPGYVGTSRIVLKDVYFGNSPNLRPLRAEISRFEDGLGLSSSGWLIIGDDINPMEALYQVFTDNWGALGKDAAGLDLPSMITAAETLFNESNGISLQVANLNSGKDIIEEILRQVDGLMFQDANTGLLVVKLVRDDYVIANLPLFDVNNIDEIKEFSRTSWADTINQLRVTYKNRSKIYEESVVMVQDAANIAQQSVVNGSSMSFPGVTTADLALQLATRELAQISVPLFKLTLVLNRTAYQLFPGAVIKVTWPKYNITELILRVQKFRSGKLDDGKIIVDCVQDVFAANTSVFAPPVDSGWVTPDTTAVLPTERLMFEVPFFMMKDLGTDVAIPPPSGSTFIATLAEEANDNQQGFSTNVEAVATLPDPVIGVDHRPYSNTAKLNAALLGTAGLTNGILTGANVLVVKDVTPNTDFLVAATEAENQTGVNLFLLNTELFTFRTVTDNGDGTFDLEEVQRALLDTGFEAHLADDLIYFFSGADEIVLQEYDGTDTIYAQYSSFTSDDETEITTAPIDSLLTSDRYDRPLPVDHIMLSTGTRSEDQVVIVPDITSFTVSWKERNRSSNVIQWEDDTTETPGLTPTYTVVLQVGGVPVTTHAGVAAGTSDPTPFSISSSEAGDAEIVITTHSGGLDSFTDSVYPFTIQDGSNLSLEDGSSILLEDGSMLKLE